MKLYLQRAIVFMLIIASGFLIFYMLKHNRYMAEVSLCVINFLVLVCYVYNSSDFKDGFFFFFFLFFSFSARLLTLTSPNIGNVFLYVLGNIVYAISFLMLIIITYRSINIKDLWDRFGMYLVVLILFSGVVIYNMNDIMYGGKMIDVLPICYITDTIYNIIIIVLLSFSFLSFIYNDSKKTLLLFLICLSFVFSDIIQLAHIYIAKYEILFYLYSVFKLIGFCLCYSYIDFKENVHYKILS